MLAYQLKNPLPDGKTVLIVQPLELIDRIAKLMPTPHTHRHRYIGVLAPASPLRPQVIAMVGQRPDDFNAVLTNDKTSKHKETENKKNTKADDSGDDNNKATTDEKRNRPLSCYLWAELLARLFGIMPLCPNCGQPMRVIAFIQSDDSLNKILTHVGLSTKPPQISPARGPPEWTDVIDQTSIFDGSEPQFEPADDFDQTVNW